MGHVLQGDLSGVIHAFPTTDIGAKFIVRTDLIISEELMVPEDSIIEFDGGMFKFTSQGKLIGQRTFIKSGFQQIFSLIPDLEPQSGLSYTGDGKILGGNFVNEQFLVEWFGALGDGMSDDGPAVNRCIKAIFNINKSRYPRVKKDNINQIIETVLDEERIEISFRALTYRIQTSITIERNNTKLSCPGTLLAEGFSSNRSVILLKAHRLEIDINCILGLTRLNNDENADFKSSYTGSAVSCPYYISHCDINVNQILYFEKGFNFSPNPSLDTNPKYNPNILIAGIQYCRIKWQNINCVFCIYIGVLNNLGYERLNQYNPQTGEFITRRFKKISWFNENQLTGGRLNGCFGIYIAPPSLRMTNNEITGISGFNSISEFLNETSGKINGNVFSSIGFEGIKIPMVLRSVEHCSFHDLRMSESIGSSYGINIIGLDLSNNVITEIDECKWINFYNCRDLRCNIKSTLRTLIDGTSIYNIPVISFDSTLVNIEALYSPNDGYDILHIFNSKCSKDRYVLGASGNEDFRFLSNKYSLTPNVRKFLSVADADTQINFTELISYPMSWIQCPVLAQICKLYLYNQGNLTVEMDDSIVGLHPDICIDLSIEAGSWLKIKNSGTNKLVYGPNTSQGASEQTISQSGIYRLTFDRDQNVFIIKL